ncbi:unnamed protein product [Sympodiomycopsis kandeliae]
MAASTVSSSEESPRVLLVGIGGPTCSGKTTLTKHLLNLITSNRSSRIKSFIIHQDDFAPPESSLVWNEKVQSADWDDPDTSVLWEKLRKTIDHVKRTGTLPDDHSSHDELNPLPDLPISDELRKRLELDMVEILKQGQQNLPTHIVFVDGFLLYFDQVVRQQIDVPIFLRIGRSLLKERRDARGGYVTADGDCWKDPPLYFDEILWPSHLKAHAHLFEGDNVETGRVLSSKGENKLTVVEAQHPPGTGSPRKIDDIVAEGCEALLAALAKQQ